MSPSILFHNRIVMMVLLDAVNGFLKHYNVLPVIAAIAGALRHSVYMNNKTAK